MEAESEEVLLIFFLFLCNAAEETEACSSQSSALVTTSLGTRSHTLASHQLICCAIRAYFCTEHRQSPTVWPKTIWMQAIFYALFLLLLYPDMVPRCLVHISRNSKTLMGATQWKYSAKSAKCAQSTSLCSHERVGLVAVAAVVMLITAEMGIMRLLSDDWTSPNLSPRKYGD